MKNQEKLPGMWLSLLALLCLVVLYFWRKPQSPEERIRKYLKNQNLSKEQTDLIVAQSKVESGNYKSEVYKRNNNAFGMRLAVVRPTTHIGDLDKDGYANYLSLEDSVQDLLLWFEYLKLSIPDKSYNYAALLKSKGYYEASQVDYYNALNSWL